MAIENKQTLVNFGYAAAASTAKAQAGYITFAQDTRQIFVGDGTNAVAFAGNVKDAAWDAFAKKLTISYNNGEPTVLDFSDIASAESVSSIMSSLRDDINANAADISTLKGDASTLKSDVSTLKTAVETLNGGASVEGSVDKAVADAKAELIGDASVGYTTLGDLQDKIVAAETAAKNAATAVAIDASASHLTIDASTDETGKTTYTIGETNIASADTLKGVVDSLAETGTVGAKIKANADAIATLKGNASTEGSVAKAVADAIGALDGGANASDANNLVTVGVTSEDGKVNGVTVEVAAGVKTAVDAAHTHENKATLDKITDASVAAWDGAVADVAILKGDASTAGSVAKAVADAKAAIEGELAETDAKTLAALNDRIDTLSTDAKTYEMKKLTEEEVTALGNANVKEAYKLIDEDKIQVGDTILIYKDSALKEVKLDGQTLNFTYILANGTEETVGVDVSAFLAESEFGNGLQVIDHVVSVKVAEGSESFLTVDASGVKLSGVQAAIDLVDASIRAEIEKNELTTAEALNDLNERVAANTAELGSLGTAAKKNVEDFDAAGAAATVKTELLGDIEDASTEMTLYGVKKYVDETVTAAALVWDVF